MAYVDNFLINNNRTVTDDQNKVIELSQENVSKFFKHIFILVKKNNISIPPEFYNFQVNNRIFDEVNDNLLIHKTSVKLLKNKSISKT